MNKFWLLVLSLLLFSCTQPPNNRIVLKVNQTEFTLEQFSQRLLEKLKAIDAHYTKDPKLFTSLKKQVQKELITEVILIQWAKKKSKLPSEHQLNEEIKNLISTNANRPEVDSLKEPNANLTQLKHSVQIQLIKRNLLDDLIQQTEVTDKEAKEYYEKHKSELAYTYIKLRQIFVDNSEVAEKVLELIKKRPRDFEDLAQKYSLSAASQGGNLGEVRKGHSKLFDALFNKPRGPIFKVYDSPQGHHIFKIVEPAKQANQSFEKAKLTVVRAIKEEKSQELYLHWLEEQVKNISVEIDDELIAAIEPFYQESL